MARQGAWSGVATGGAAVAGRVVAGGAGPAGAGARPERPPWPTIWLTRTTAVSRIATAASSHSAT